MDGAHGVGETHERSATPAGLIPSPICGVHCHPPDTLFDTQQMLGGLADPRGEAVALASRYRRALEVADELGAESVTFSAISIGAFGFPEAEGAVIAG